MEQHPLFSSRDTLDEVVVYGVELLNTLPPEHRMTAFTAFHVLSNTALKLQEPAMKNLTPDWHSTAKPITPDTPQAELFQQLRTILAPFTSSIILALEQAEERGMTGSLLFTKTGGKMLNRVCKILATLAGLDKEAHEQEVQDFHDQMEKAMPKTPLGTPRLPPQDA